MTGIFKQSDLQITWGGRLWVLIVWQRPFGLLRDDLKMAGYECKTQVNKLSNNTEFLFWSPEIIWRNSERSLIINDFNMINWRRQVPSKCHQKRRVEHRRWCTRYGCQLIASIWYSTVDTLQLIQSQLTLSWEFLQLCRRLFDSTEFSGATSGGILICSRS